MRAHFWFQEKVDMAAKHEVQNLDKPEHVSAKAIEGGQCLSGHLSRYTLDNSCSYRWQGLKKPKKIIISMMLIEDLILLLLKPI